MKGVVVKKSNIHGKGIFAARDFRKGEVILYWNTAHIITKSEVQKLSQRQLPYVSKYGRKYILHQPPARYMNHSCNPNTKIGKDCDIAIRSIKKGEEITTDYRFEGSPVDGRLCHCGQATCRKMVV